jgi:hypothetical protein
MLILFTNTMRIQPVTRLGQALIGATFFYITQALAISSNKRC